MYMYAIYVCMYVYNIYIYVCMYAYYVDPQWKKFQPDGRLYYHPLRNCTQIVCTLSLKQYVGKSSEQTSWW